MLSAVAEYIATKGTQKVAIFQSLCGVVPTGVQNTKKSNAYNLGGVRKGAPTNIPFHVLMKIGTFLGGESFYSIAWSMLLVFCDCMVYRRLLTLWFVLYYVGQYLKDLLQLPRPLSPPALKLEHLDEYGMPSTHAMGAFGCSIYLAIMLPEISNYQFSAWVTISIAVIWTLTVCISRVYMGSHTFEDVIGGLILAGSILIGFRSIESNLDSFFLKTDYMPFYLFALITFLLIIYPKPHNSTWSESFGDTAIVGGVFCGCMIAFWYGARYGSEPDFAWLIDEVSFAPKEFLSKIQNIERIKVIILSAFVLLPLVMAFKFLVKAASIKVLKAIFREPKKDKTYRVEGTAKLLAYMSIGLSQVSLYRVVENYMTNWLQSS